MLLGTIVNVALLASALGISRGDHTLPGGPQLSGPLLGLDQPPLQILGQLNVSQGDASLSAQVTDQLLLNRLQRSARSLVHHQPAQHIRPVPDRIAMVFQGGTRPRMTFRAWPPGHHFGRRTSAGGQQQHLYGHGPGSLAHQPSQFGSYLLRRHRVRNAGHKASQPVVRGDNEPSVQKPSKRIEGDGDDARREHRQQHARAVRLPDQEAATHHNYQIDSSHERSQLADDAHSQAKVSARVSQPRHIPILLQFPGTRNLKTRSPVRAAKPLGKR